MKDLGPLIAVFEETRALLAAPGNDFLWSWWEGPEDALEEIDRMLATLRAGRLPDDRGMWVLFAPTGPIQEVSIGSGWGSAFLERADRFDAAMAAIACVTGAESPPGKPKQRVEGATSDLAREETRAIYEIDGRRCSTLEGFYDEVSRVVIPSATWGHNLDALNDILRGGFGTPGQGFTLRWLHHAVSREMLGYPESVRQLELRLGRCHPANRHDVMGDLARARAGVGPTVFDWLVEIIELHGPGGEGEEDGVMLVLA